MNKKVLTTTLVYDPKNRPKFSVPCNSNTCYGKYEDDGYGTKKNPAIDFKKNGWWPAKDFIYIPPNKVDDIDDCFNEFEHRKFAQENGIYVMVVKVAKLPAKKIKINF